MQIGPNIPLHVARAYGVQPAARTPGAPAAQPAKAATPTGPVGKIALTTPTGRVSPAGEVQGVARPQQVGKLVAGTVERSLNFDGAATVPNGSPHTLQLYNRAADKIEAAVAVNIGRAIDVSG